MPDQILSGAVILSSAVVGILVMQAVVVMSLGRIASALEKIAALSTAKGGEP